MKVVDVYLQPPEEYMIGDTNVDDLMDIIISKYFEQTHHGSNSLGNLLSPSLLEQQGKNGFERYLKSLEVSKVRTLEEIIHFNEDNADIELHNGMPCQYTAAR